MKNRFPALTWTPPESSVSACTLKPLEVWGDGSGVLVLGDSLDVLGVLGDLTGRPHLIYMDPPFATGHEFGLRSGGRKAPAYDDRWEEGLAGYLDMLGPRLMASARLLGENGSLFVHLDWHAVHYVKVLLDIIMGYDAFVNEIIWHYYNKFSRGRRALPRAHDTILWYANGPGYTFHEVRAAREKPVRQLRRIMVDGKLVNARDDEGNLLYREVTDRKVDDVWTLPQLQPASSQWTGYPTQKHQILLETIVLMASDPGDLVLDPFCGSGTTAAAAHAHGRRWAAVDLSPAAIAVTRMRMAGQGAGFTLYACSDRSFPELNTSVHAAVEPTSSGPVVRLSGPTEQDLIGWCVGDLIDGVIHPVWWSFASRRTSLELSTAPLPQLANPAVRLYGHHGQMRTIPLIL